MTLMSEIPVNKDVGNGMDEFSDQMFQKDETMRAVVMITVQEVDRGAEGNADVHMSIRATDAVTPAMIADVLRDMAQKLMEQPQSTGWQRPSKRIN